MQQNGRLFVLEGIDGTGKTTQAKRLKTWLEEHTKNRVHLWREPGGTPLGEKIRSLLLNEEYCHKEPKSESIPDSQQEPAEWIWRPLSRALLFSAARHQLWQDAILPARKKGEWAVLDRSVDSFYAYQGAGEGVGVDILSQLVEWTTGKIPEASLFDAVITLDGSLELAQSRLGKRFQNENAMQNVLNEYRKRARLNPLAVLIDAHQPREAIFLEITKYLINRQFVI